MKEIKNWYVVVNNNGEEEIGILLPGCTVKGVIEVENLSVDISINVVDIDMATLVVTSDNGKTYKLAQINKEYLQNLNKCIEIGINEMDKGEI